MFITQEEIQNIAQNLVKINIQNPSKIHKDINEALSCIDDMKNIDTTGVAPTINVISKDISLLKKDEVSQTILPEHILKCSPQPIIANQIAVNNIM